LHREALHATAAWPRLRLREAGNSRLWQASFQSSMRSMAITVMLKIDAKLGTIGVVRSIEYQ